MSNIIYDFLINSKLTHLKYVDTYYKDLSEIELRNELDKYKEYILSNSQKLQKEAVNKGQISVAVESFGKLPDETLFKQLIMYVDRIVVDDPIFHHTNYGKDGFSDALSSLMNIKDNNAVDRKRLAIDINYILSNAELIISGILNLYPIWLLHNQNRNVSLLYSENNFADSVPVELKRFFYDRVKVCNIKDNVIKKGTKLELGRNILVEFEGASSSHSMGFLLMKTAFNEINKEIGHFEMSSHVPDDIPSQDSFDIWVEQSINRTAGRVFKETLNEVIFSNHFNSMYLAKSDFTSELLSIPYLSMRDMSSDLANLALSLDLPIIDNIGLDTLLKIRTDDGQAFENFRISLQSKLKELRLITDPMELSIKLENLQHELLETEINSVNKASRNIKRNLGIDAALLVGSLVSSYFTGGLTMIGAAGALAKGFTDFSKYYSDVKENNGYFLWKVSKASKR